MSWLTDKERPEIRGETGVLVHYWILKSSCLRKTEEQQQATARLSSYTWSLSTHMMSLHCALLRSQLELFVPQTERGAAN